MKKTDRSLVAVPLAIATTILTTVSPSFADLPPLIPRQILFENPVKSNPQISPDGKYLTYIAPDKNNVLQLWLRTVGKQDDRILTANKKDGIYNYFWTYNGQQLIYQQDVDGDENWHFYAVDIESNNVRDLTPYKGIQAEMIALNPKFPNQALIGMNLKDFRKVDAYRIDLKSGKS